MGVKVAFIDNQPAQASSTVVEVSKSALRRVENQDVVFVVAGNRAERRAVKVVSVENDRARIAAGVREGEQVIIEGPADLADGDNVRIEEKKG
jgi:hypothetical protein